MGTDIHGRSQVRYGQGAWFNGEEIENTRNYRLFAALAGVRNGFGFAGHYTHDPIMPIVKPRGLPDDFVNDEYESYMGDHSFSWLHISEIVSWPGWDMCLSDDPEHYGLLGRKRVVWSKSVCLARGISPNDDEMASQYG